jgi:hypothetical protein
MKKKKEEQENIVIDVFNMFICSAAKVALLLILFGILFALIR